MGEAVVNDIGALRGGSRPLRSVARGSGPPTRRPEPGPFPPVRAGRGPRARRQRRAGCGSSRTLGTSSSRTLKRSLTAREGARLSGAPGRGTPLSFAPTKSARSRARRPRQGEQIGPEHRARSAGEPGPPRTPGSALPPDLREARLSARCHVVPSRCPSVPTVPSWRKNGTPTAGMSRLPMSLAHPGAGSAHPSAWSVPCLLR